MMLNIYSRLIAETPWDPSNDPLFGVGTVVHKEISSAGSSSMRCTPTTLFVCAYVWCCGLGDDLFYGRVALPAELLC